MEVYQIRDALRLLNEDSVMPDKSWFKVRFDDGVEVVTNNRKLMYTNFFFEFHRQYPLLPMLSRHCIEHVLKGKLLNTSTNQELLSILSEDTCNTYNIVDAKSMANLMRLCLSINNKIYNVVSTKARANIFSINIFDMLELIHHPVMETIYADVCNRKITIKQSYALTTKFLLTDKSVAKNNAVIAVRAKMLNMNQVMQCIMVRGYTTEVDGQIMANPVMTNFTRGLHTVHAFVAESRSAAKNYYFSEDPIQKAEYFARRLQLLTMSVERVHHGVDCGSTKYVDWLVNPPTYDENKELTYPGDLLFMVGIFYWDEASQSLKKIKLTDTHLNGTTIKMRSALTCNHADKHGICHVCFGDLAKNIPEHANLGHICSCVMTKQTTQNVLSTKHLDATAVAVAVVISMVGKIYFQEPDMHQNIKFKKCFAKAGLFLIVDKDEARGLTEITHMENLNKVNISRLSMIDTVEIRREIKGVTTVDRVKVAQTSRFAHFTRDFLQFVKNNHYELDSNGNYVFDLTNWNFKQGVFQFVKKEQNFSQHSQQVASIIESRMEELTDRNNPESPVKTLRELFNIANSKLRVHLSCLQVIIYACMTPNKNSYDMARGAPAPVMGVHGQLILNRSLSAQYVYEDLGKAVSDPSSFTYEGRPDHVLDVYFDPSAVVNAYYPIKY